MDEQKLLAFRTQKDEHFKNEEESPLTEEQKQTFAGLKYYPLNPNLVFKNLEISQIDDEQIIQITTSAGDADSFKRLGTIHFQISGTDCSLTVFQDLYGQTIFLPFKDQTNGQDTYSSGRYVEVEKLDNKIAELDFNYAYNPYCAYNHNFRCPLTPPENNLPVEIEAGEKLYQ